MPKPNELNNKTFQDEAKAREWLEALVQANTNKIFALLKERNIAENDVIASDLKSEPQYAIEDRNSLKQGKIVGYAVTRSFSVKVRDVTAFAKLVDELLAMGGTEFCGIDTGLIKEKEVTDEIYEKALTNARERADKTLKTMSMKVDSVFGVSAAPFPEIQSKMFAATERVVVTGYYIPPSKTWLLRNTGSHP